MVTLKIEQYINHFFTERCPLPPWARRLGFYGFMFFLLKGIGWIVFSSLLITNFI